jgi:DNA-binding MarR family transcriptional regulator
VDPSAPERLHRLLMELVRVVGVLQPDQAVPGHAISLSQAYALHELDTDSPLSQRELAERLRLEKSSVSRMAADLEEQGLLVRERDAVNRRVYRLRLTDQGRAVHAQLGAAFHAQYLRWTAAMTPAELDALLVGLHALVHTIRADSDSIMDFSRDPPGDSLKKSMIDAQGGSAGELPAGHGGRGGHVEGVHAATHRDRDP